MKPITRRELLRYLAGGAALAGLSSSARILAEQEIAMNRPNVLILMTDHQRYDSIGMVQSGVEVTPNLNRLAEQSAVFTRAYNTCPLCVPARTALFTGKHPTRNGVVHNDWAGKTAGDHESLYDYLQDAGYEVAHVGVDHIKLKPGLRQRVEFDFWRGGGDYGRYQRQSNIPKGLPGGKQRYKKRVRVLVDGKPIEKLYSRVQTGVWPHPAEHFMDNFFADQALEFIRQPHQKPFLLTLALWAPHPPLVVPEPYASMFDSGRLDLPPNVGVPAAGEPPNRRNGIAGQLAEGVTMEEWRKAWAAHLGLVRLADDALGRVLKALEESGRADSTLVVFTVDHGDHLGQHSMAQKMEMYEQAIRVPMMIRAPDGQAGSFDTPVSHLDLMPTLLEMAGLAVPAGLDGESLRECIETGAPPRQRAIFSQYSGNAALGDLRRTIITRRYKYTYDPRDVPELYDLEDDPLETSNVAAEAVHAELARDLHAQLKAWGESTGDWIDYGD